MMTTQLSNAHIRTLQIPFGRQLMVAVLALTALLTVAQPADTQAKDLPTTELRGTLAGRNAYHMFGLEPIQPEGPVALALVSDRVAPSAGDATVPGAGFAVLDEAGVLRFLAGADPLEVALITGAPLPFDPLGNRRTALVSGAKAGGYTVIVYSLSELPATYALEVQGGVLRDDAGQGSAVTPVGDREPLPAVHARRLTAALAPDPGRHVLSLTPEPEAAELTLTLQYLGRSAGHDDGPVRFWVLTEDGMRQVAQGGRIEELNLTRGAPSLSLAGTRMLTARLRLASGPPYVVVVENRGDRPLDYTLTVAGALLMDQLGQTNEARAAALEELALAQ